jgi:hypothetical protein
MFEKLSDNTSGFVLAADDDKNLESCDIRNALFFDSVTLYQARDIVYHPLRTEFQVNGQEFKLSLPGSTIYTTRLHASHSL